MKTYQAIEFLSHMSTDTLIKVYRALKVDRDNLIKQKEAIAVYCEKEELVPFFVIENVLDSDIAKTTDLMQGLKYLLI